MLKLIAGLLAALLVYGGSIVLGASAGTSTKAGPSKAQAPKTMSLACAKNGDGKLQYVAAASGCPASRGKLVRFPQDRPVRACQLIKGNPGVSKAALPPPAHPHHVAGMLFRVAAASQCHGPKYPDSKAVTLPKAFDQKLCAGSRHGTVRAVNAFSQCNNLEFDVILRKAPAPHAANDAATTDEDHFKNVNVLANDTGLGPLHVSILDKTGTKGAVTKNGNGTLRYDPSGKFESLKVGQTGHDSFKYRANDGFANSNLATVSLTITGVNDAPTAVDETATTDKDTSTTIAVLANDTDPDGDTLGTASVDTTGTKGAVTINGDGTIKYDPNGQFASLGPNDSAHDTFKYRANDSHVDSNAATVDVTVTGVNHPPVLSNIESGPVAYDTGSGDAQVTNSLEVSEPDGTDLKSATVKVGSGFNSPTDATKGADTLSFTPELGITASYDSSTGVLTLTSTSGSPASDWQQALRDVKYSASAPTPSGGRTLSFQIDDGGSGNHLSNVVTRDVTLTHVNHAPVAAGDTPTTTEDASTNVAVLANDSDPDEDTPLHVASTDTTGTVGQVTLNPDNTFTYNPNGQFNGLKPGDSATDSFKYRAADPSNSPSNEVTVTVTVTGINDAPVLAAIEGGALAYGTGSAPVSVTSSTTVADDDNANLKSATVSISSGFNSPTDATPGEDALSFTPELGISGSYSSSTGVLALTSASGSSVSDWQQALRDVKYAASAPTPSGSRTVSFQIDDGEAANHASNTVSRGITLTHLNHAPVASDDTATTSEDVSTSKAVLANDSDVDGDTPLHVASVDTTGTTGTVTINGDNTITYDPNGQFNGLKPGETASDTFKYKAADPSNADSNQATVTVTVTGVNDAPVLAAIEGTALAYDTGSGPAQITNGTTVADVDNANLKSATVAITSNYNSPTDATPGADTLSFVPELGITGSYDSSTGILTLTSASGTAKSDWQQALHDVKYSASAPTASGSRQISFQIDDGEVANHASNVVTRDVTLTHLNHVPTANDDTDSTTEDLFKDVAVLTNDSDPDLDALHVSSVDATGTLGTVTVNGDNTIKYDPNGQFESLAPGDSAQDTFKYKAADTSNADSNAGTVTVTINGVNDAPALAAIEGTALAYDTGDPASPITSTITATDVDNANLKSATVSISTGYNSPTDATAGSDSLAFANQLGISGSFDSSTGVLTLTTGAGGVSKSDWETALRAVKFFSTGPSPSGTRTITFQVDDGAAANHASNTVTRDIAVTNDNQAPTDIGLSQDTIASDQPIGTAVGTFTTLDPDAGDPHTYTLVSGTGSTDNGKFTIDGDTLKTAISLPSGDYSIRVQTDDGRGGTFQEQFTIHAIPDDPPDDIGLDNTSVAENQPQGTDVGNLSTLGDTDGGPTFTYSLVAGNGTNDVDNGDFQINGSVLEVSHALDFEAKAQRKIVIRTDDGKGAHFDKAFTIDVTNVNEAPTSVSLTNSSVAENQPSGTNVGALSGTDPENDTLTFSLASGVTDNDSFKITGGNQLDTNAVFDFETKSSYTVTVTAKDPGNLSKDQTFPITITNVNEAPVVTAGGTLNYTENQLATAIDTGITVTEPDGEMLSSGSASITTGFQSGEDVLEWTDTDGPGGITLGPSTNQTVNLTGAGTAAQYATALKAVTYRNSSDAPTTADRTVTFSVTDSNASSLSGSATSTVKVAAVDDPPDANDDTHTLLEDEPTPANKAIDVLANDTDGGDGGLKEITAIGSASHGTVAGTGGSANHWTGLTYTPTANYCNSPDATPSATPDTFTYTVNGGDTAQVSVTVTCVNDTPVATTDSFTAVVGNTAYVVDDTNNHGGAADGPISESGPKKSVTGDIIANDTDVESSNSQLTVVAGTFLSADGGSVTIESDGDFKYVSDPPESGTGCNDTSDSFTYTVSDNDSGGAQTALGTVNITLSGCAWYVSNSATGNDGTSTLPFDTLAQAQTASANGDSIYVFKGDGSTTGQTVGIDLKQDQRLIGEAADLVVGGTTLKAGDSTKRPTITDSASDVVAMASNNEVRGLELDPSGGANGGGIAAGSGDAGGTIDDVRIIDDDGTAGQQAGLEVDSSTGTWNVSNLDVQTTSGATGIRVKDIGGANVVNFLATGTISSQSNGGKALDVTATAGTTNLGSNSQFDLLKSTGSNAGGVGIVNATGTTHLGDGSGTDLDLTTTSGGSAGLLLINAGTVDIPAAGSSDIHATGGPAVDVTGTSGATLSLDDVDSTNSATTGINISGLGAGTFTAASGDITGAAGTSFALAGGSGKVSYAGNFGNGSATTAIDISGRSGGTGVNGVTLSGNISDTNDLGGTINVHGNSAGDITLSGSTKQANTTGPSSNGTADGVLYNSSTGGSLTLSGGGLDIDTISGKGLEADTSGTLAVTGTGNTIDTGSGKSLNETNTDTAAAGITFDHISGNGANAGIVLNNTGSNNALTVTGTSSGLCGGTTTAPANLPATGVAPITSDCTGGTIQNTTGADDAGSTPAGTAVLLKDTTGVSLTRMRMNSNSNYGIRGTNVNGLTLSNSLIDGTNGTSALTANKDSSSRFDNLTGTVSMTNVSMSGGFTSNLLVNNTTGTLNATLDSFQSGTLDATGGDDAVQFEGLVDTSSTMNVTVEESIFTTATGDIFQYIGNGTGGGALTFTQNRVSNNEPSIATGGGGLTLSGADDGAVTMDIQHNSFRDSHTSALTINKSRDNDGADNAQTVTVNDNTIGVTGVDSSGSLEGSGISTTNFGDGNQSLTVTNNNVRQYNSTGMRFIAGAGLAENGQLNLNISGNTILEPGTNPSITLLQGIRVESGVTAGDTFQTCANFGSNIMHPSGDPALSGGASDYRLVAAQSTTVRLPGYGGSSTDDAAVVSFVNGKIGNGATGTAVHVAPATWSGTGTTCP